MATKKKKVVEPRALVLHEIALSPRQTGIVYSLTPPAFVKKKPGRGGRSVEYVEVGYVINQLNVAFSPLGWDFDIVESGESVRSTEKSAEGEVWVKGKLTIIDHVKGWKVTKTQYGQHPIHKNVPVGDAYKAASSDSLKKCASLLGIAQDVYWGQDDTQGPATGKPEGKKDQMKPEEMFERAKAMLSSVRDISVLFEYLENMKESKTYNTQQKKELEQIISAKVDSLQQ